MMCESNTTAVMDAKVSTPIPPDHPKPVYLPDRMFMLCEFSTAWRILDFVAYLIDKCRVYKRIVFVLGFREALDTLAWIEPHAAALGIKITYIGFPELLPGETRPKYPFENIGFAAVDKLSREGEAGFYKCYDYGGNTNDIFEYFESNEKDAAALYLQTHQVPEWTYDGNDVYNAVVLGRPEFVEKQPIYNIYDKMAGVVFVDNSSPMHPNHRPEETEPQPDRSLLVSIGQNMAHYNFYNDLIDNYPGWDVITLQAYINGLYSPFKDLYNLVVLSSAKHSVDFCHIVSRLCPKHQDPPQDRNNGKTAFCY